MQPEGHVWAECSFACLRDMCGQSAALPGATECGCVRVDVCNKKVRVICSLRDTCGQSAAPSGATDCGSVRANVQQKGLCNMQP
eukprot:662013-Pelagomonas_calceolata.AAC.4